MKCLYPLTFMKTMSDGVKRRITVPCGKCLACEQKRASQFAQRAIDELQFWDTACVVTLTYNDEHLPENSWLCRRDVQLFAKRLRKSLGDDHPIRIYGCGEYGSKKGRPHYHLIIYGWSPSDCDFHFVKRGRKHYLSATVERLWSVYKGNTSDNKPIFEPIGYCDVCLVVDEKTCFYCAKYLQKRVQSYMPDAPNAFMITPREGLGKRAISDKMLSGSMYRNGRKLGLPRYYRQKLAQAHPWFADWCRMEFLRHSSIYKEFDEKDYIKRDSFDRMLR